MPADIQITIDEHDIRKKLEKLSAKSGVSIQFICWDQLRLWTQSMLKMTYPKKLAEGRLTVEAGVAELFRPIEVQEAFEHWKMRAAEKNADIITYTKRGKMRVSRASLKGYALSAMHEVHKSARTSRGGVSRSKATKKDGGGWGFSGEMLVGQSEYRKFLKMKQDQVGFLKAGWVPALKFWARKANANASVPAWVERHATKQGYPAGSIDERGNGFVKAVNAVAYANQRISQQGIIEASKQKAQRDLRDGAFKRMDDLAKRFNAEA